MIGCLNKRDSLGPPRAQAVDPDTGLCAACTMHARETVLRNMLAMLPPPLLQARAADKIERELDLLMAAGVTPWEQAIEAKARRRGAA